MANKPGNEKMWCKLCVASTAIMWVTLIAVYAERISKYGWEWVWQPFTH